MTDLFLRYKSATINYLVFLFVQLPVQPSGGMLAPRLQLNYAQAFLLPSFDMALSVPLFWSHSFGFAIRQQMSISVVDKTPGFDPGVLMLAITMAPERHSLL